MEETWQGTTFAWNSGTARHMRAVFNIYLPSSWGDEIRWDTAIASLTNQAQQRQST